MKLINDTTSQLSFKYDILNKLFDFPFRSLSDFDFSEEENSYVMVRKLPENISFENIDIEYDDADNLITIRFEYANSYKSFKSEESYSLPEDADSKSIKARIDNSLLTIIVDKKK